MSTPKTRPTEASVNEFLNSIEDEQKRKDCFEVLELMRSITGEEPVMWGPSIVGFGSYHYKYESGREGDMILTGFSPRKQNLSLYIMSGFKRHDELMSRLGKYKTGKSCLYVKRLHDVDREILGELIQESIVHVRKTWG